MEPLKGASLGKAPALPEPLKGASLGKASALPANIRLGW